MYEYIDKVIEERYATLSPEKKALVRNYVASLQVSPEPLVPSWSSRLLDRLGIESPKHKNSARVAAVSILSMTTVLITALVSASAGYINMLLLVPAYGVFAIFVLQLRQFKLNRMAL